MCQVVVWMVGTSDIAHINTFTITKIVIIMFSWLIGWLVGWLVGDCGRFFFVLYLADFWSHVVWMFG